MTVVTALMIGMSVGAGPAEAAPAYRHTVAPKVVRTQVGNAAVRFAKQYVVLRKHASRAAAARELSMVMSVRGPRHGSHVYVATLATAGARAVIGLRPGQSLGRNGRAVADRGPTACATIRLRALDKGRKRSKAVKVRLGTVATPRAHCVRR